MPSLHSLNVPAPARPSSIFLVFEFCENDLACIIDNVKDAFSEAQVKCILMQILEGVAYCHDHFVLHRCVWRAVVCPGGTRWGCHAPPSHISIVAHVHRVALASRRRDLKMSNILYSGRGDVKIADFGLARKFGLPVGRYTPKVPTEGKCDALLSSCTAQVVPTAPAHHRLLRCGTAHRSCYSEAWTTEPASTCGASGRWRPVPHMSLRMCVCTVVCRVATWRRAVGCIMGELLKSAPVMPGKNEMDQIKLMYKLLGAPNDRIWPGARGREPPAGHRLAPPAAT